MIGSSLIDESDEYWMILFRQGNVQEYHKLYNKYAPAVLGVLVRTLGDQQLAEACVQESFCEAWSQRLNFDPAKERLFTWMLKIARTCAGFKPFIGEKSVDEAIRQHINLVYATDVKIFLEGQKNKEIFTKNADALIREAIDLIYFKGYSFAIAAEQLKTSVNELKVGIIKIVKQLRGSVLA